MAIFSFLARLGLDTTQFESGIKRAQTSATGFSKSINGQIGGGIRGVGSALAGVFTVGAIAKFTSHMADVVGEIKDMSELLGISTDDVQRLQAAAADAGQPFSRVVTALQKIEAMKAQALTGDEKAGGIFSILGINPGEASSLEILKRATTASANGVKENAAAFELLGTKVGGVKRVVDELNSSKPINLINPEAIQRIDEATKAYERFKRSISSGATEAAGNILANIGIAAKAVEAHTEAEFIAKQQGLTGEEARQFRLNYMGREITKMRMENLGIPLPGDARSTQKAEQDDAVTLLRRIAESNEKTFEAINDNISR